MVKAIDASMNAFFPQFAKRSSRFGYWKFLGPRWEQLARVGWTVDVMIAAMDRADVKMAGLVAFSAANSTNGADCFISAEELAPIFQAHPGRFFGIAGLNPLLPPGHAYHAPRYLERAVKGLGFRGGHLALHWFDMSPGDKRLYPIYEACMDLDVPIVIPLGAAPPRSGGRTVAEPVMLDPIIGDFPELHIVGQRIGYPWERESVYLARNNPNFSIAADWPEPPYWSPDLIAFIKQGRFPKYDAGSDQIMWGSDFPMQEPAKSRQQLEQLGFNDSMVAQILHDNAVRVFKLAGDE
jgi:predicted TIM-barrel fold metal-dependent hydrolase